jgi:hypothetical protein
MNKTDDQLRADIRRNESLADWSGWVLLFGLALELILIFAWWPHEETLLTRLPEAVATLLIVLGVWGELHFGRKESEARAELQSRSDVRIAELVAKAADAELETERLRRELSWRRLPSDMISKLEATLKGKPAGSLLISHTMNDPESQSFAKQVGAVFHTVGWRVSHMACSFGSQSFFGIVVPNEGDAADDAIGQALVTAGIEHVSAPPPHPFMSTGDGIQLGQPFGRLFVGQKPMPDVG